MALGLTPYQIIEKGTHPQLVIADESQNFTRKELVTLITRIGNNSKYFILRFHAPRIATHLF